LKDLAKIDPKYNVAVTVSNHLWEHWVCDNDTTAEECINTLKAKGLVYQNFICLNKLTQQMQQMKRPFNPPQGSLRLFDLLQFNKPEVAPAFYKACRDTIVVDNLDVAQKIAYGSGGGYRVTTLRGDIIDPNGECTSNLAYSIECIHVHAVCSVTIYAFLIHYRRNDWRWEAADCRENEHGHV
jgi:structural maintenance of chromosome 4